MTLLFFWRNNMKSHELAKLLLSQPNLEIYHYDAESDLHYQNFDNRLMVTPSGIFTTVKPTSVSENVLTPYETPSWVMCKFSLRMVLLLQNWRVHIFKLFLA